MKAFVLAATLLTASCGPHQEPSNAAKSEVVTVPPPSAVPASPRIPADHSPPVATTDPPERQD